VLEYPPPLAEILDPRLNSTKFERPSSNGSKVMAFSKSKMAALGHHRF